jgi:hypothetical protein
MASVIPLARKRDPRNRRAIRSIRVTLREMGEWRGTVQVFEARPLWADVAAGPQVAPAPQELSAAQVHHPARGAAGVALLPLTPSCGGQPNGPHVRCGALKKDPFPNLRAPPASSAG